MIRKIALAVFLMAACAACGKKVPVRPPEVQMTHVVISVSAAVHASGIV